MHSLHFTDEETESQELHVVPPRSQRWRQAKPGFEPWALWLRHAVPGGHCRHWGPECHHPWDIRALATAVLCFVCPCPLRFLSKVLRNHRTPCASGGSQAVCQETSSSRGGKKKEKNVFLVPEIGAPGGPGRRGVLHPSPVLAFFLPLSFAALGGTTSVCWVPHLDEASVPHRSLLDPLHGAAAFIPGSSRGTRAWFWDPLSMASQSPDPRCLRVLGGLLWLL